MSLRWNTSEYGGVKDLRIPPHRLWKPGKLIHDFTAKILTYDYILTHFDTFNDATTLALATILSVIYLYVFFSRLIHAYSSYVYTLSSHGILASTLRLTD